MTKKIFILAGEASGDLLGADLITALKKQFNNDVTIIGVGGEKMKQAGLSASLFPMQEIAVMGIVEVIKNIHKIYKRINELVNFIAYAKPDMVITIDAQELSYILHKRVAKLGLDIKQLHYVAPTVWAWRAKRAKKVAKVLDALCTLFPFEPQYFEKEGLATHFVGHPLTRYPALLKADSDRFKNKYNLQDDEIIISVLPGSRASEISRMAPIFKELITVLNQQYKNLKFFIPTSLQHLDKNKAHFALFHNVYFITDEQEKYDAFKASTLALAKSGTVSLELALLGVPHLIAYKASALSVCIFKYLAKIKSVNLINIIAGKKVIAELLQDDCDLPNLLQEIERLINDKAYRSRQQDDMKKACDALYLQNQMTPSEKIADVVCSMLK